VAFKGRQLNVDSEFKPSVQEVGSDFNELYGSYFQGRDRN